MEKRRVVLVARGHGPENAQADLVTSKFTIDCLKTQANHNHAFIDTWLQDSVCQLAYHVLRVQQLMLWLCNFIDVVAVQL